MSKWKEIFDKAFNEFEDVDELEMEYRFLDPASEEQLNLFENKTSGSIPPDLRSLYQEFNGICVKEKYWGWENLYLPISESLEELQDYFNTSGNPIPPESEIENVAFFAQQNGYAILYGVCCSSFGKFKTGQVLGLDHETGEFELESKTLEEFVKDSWHCTLS